MVAFFKNVRLDLFLVDIVDIIFNLNLNEKLKNFYFIIIDPPPINSQSLLMIYP